MLPLAFHVTYWNNLGWQYPFSFQAATDRQEGYVALRGDNGVYTPQMVVDGAQSFVGSRHGEAEAAIGRAESEQVTAAPLHLSRKGVELGVEVGHGAGQGTVLAQRRCAGAPGEAAGLLGQVKVLLLGHQG